MYSGGIEDNAPIHVLCVGSCCGAHRNRLSKTVPLRKACAFRHPSQFERVHQKAKKREKGWKIKVKAKSSISQSKCARHTLLPFHPSIQVFLVRREIASSPANILLVQVGALVALPALALLVVLALLALVPRVVADRALSLLAEAVSGGLLVRLLVLKLVGSATECCREVRWKERKAWCGWSLRGRGGGAVSKCREDSRNIRLVRAGSSRLWLLLLVTLLLVVVHRLWSLRLGSWGS